MKRSTFISLSIILILVEIAFSIYSLDSHYNFLNLVVDAKYLILCVAIYTGFTVFTIGYLLTMVLTYFFIFELHFDKMYGRSSFNFIYTYHYAVFAVVMFVTSAWPWFIESVILFAFWEWVRVNQNDYADEYELTVIKENAKRKTTVELE